MWMRRARGVVSAALAMTTAMALCACGDSASSASSDGLSSASGPAASISAAAANPVTVSPLPGTEDASPATQISFLGASRHAGLKRERRRLASGAHSGRIEALLDRHGRELPALAPVSRRRAGDGARDGHDRDRRPGPDGEHDVHDRPPGGLSARRSSRTTPATRTRSSTTARRRR